jgi:hypothetical protein
MDSSLFKYSEKIPDGALYRAKIHIFENVGLISEHRLP